MRDEVAPSAIPDVPIRLELAASLAAAADRGRPGYGGFQRAIEVGVGAILASLGVPGRPVVEIAALADDSSLAGRFLRVRANGRPCPHSDDLLHVVHSYTTGRPLAADVTLEGLLTWLGDGTGDHSREFLSLACIEIVKVRPHLLFGTSQAQAYTESLRAAATTEPKVDGWPGEAESLQGMLKELLDLRISIADQGTTARILQQGMAAGRDRRALVEDLIEALRPRVLELQMPEADLRQFTTDWQETGAIKLPLLRDGLFDELGIKYPDFTFVATNDLKAGTFRFKVNHLTTAPFVALDRARGLVNVAADKLPAGLSGEPGASPITRAPHAIVERHDLRVAEQAGLTTWDQLEYLILCLADTLRVHGASFVDRRIVTETVQTVTGAFPKLGETVKRRVSLEDLTHLFRQLVQEQVSIRNVRLILEATVDYAPASETDRLGFVRRALGRQISARQARGSSTVVVYLLDDVLEKLAAYTVNHINHGNMEWTDRNAGTLSLAIKTEIDVLRRQAPSASVPAVLTFPEVRRLLRELIAAELPRLQILAFSEVPPLMNVQPVARIGPVSSPTV